MPAPVPNTVLRNGVYQFKKRIPQHLREHPIFAGKEFYQRSLGTADRSVAIRKMSAMLTEFEQLCARAERKAASVNGVIRTAPRRASEITDDLLAYLARQHRDLIVRDDAATRRMAGREGPDSLTADYLDFRDQFLNSDVTTRYEAIKRRDISVVRPSAVAALTREGVENAEHHPRMLELCDLLIEAELDAAAAIKIQIERGELEPEPVIEKLRRAPKLHPQKGGTSLETVKGKYFAVATCSEDWRKKVERAVQSFTASQGELSVERINRKHVTDWVQEMLQAPAYATQKGDKADRRVSPTTVRDGSLAAFKRLLTHAVDCALIDANPASNVRVPSGRISGKRRRPFEIGELEALFRLPVFTGCAGPERINSDGSHLLDDHRYWAPLIALYTGARASEIAQIRINHIGIESDVRFVRIAIDANDDESSLKTAAAFRKVPIHDKLIELGFWEYVERRKRAGGERLFAKWERATNGRYSDSRSQRNFNEKLCTLIRSHDPKPTFHSFRHNVKSALAAASVTPQLQNFLIGHEQAGQDKNYVHEPPLDRLNAAMQALDYPGLDLSHLLPDQRKARARARVKAKS
jgi:integrase